MKFPSEHRIGDLGYSLEIQIEGENELKQNIVLSILFEVRKKFENKKIKNLFLDKNISLIKIDKSYIVKNLNLNNLLFDKKRFYMYKGQSTNFPCKFSLVFIALDTEFIGLSQIGGYSLNVASLIPVQQKNKKQKIYQNFLPLTDNYFVNKLQSNYRIFHSDFPIPIEYSSFVYNPTDEDNFSSLGQIPKNLEKYRPFWLPPQKYANIPEFNFLNGTKLFTLFYKFNPDTNKWEERIVVVPIDLEIIFDKQLKSLPILIRSSTMIENNNVRVLDMINIPIIYEEEKKKQNNDLNNPNDKDFITNEEKMSTIEKEVAKINKNFFESIFETCIKVKLDEVLNLPINNLKVLKKYNKNTEKKFDIEKHCLLKYKFDLNNLFNATNNLNFHFLDNFCDYHLHVILNKQNNNTLSDFVERDCMDLKKRFQQLLKMSNLFRLFLGQTLA